MVFNVWCFRVINEAEVIVAYSIVCPQTADYIPPNFEAGGAMQQGNYVPKGKSLSIHTRHVSILHRVWMVHGYIWIGWKPIFLNYTCDTFENNFVNHSLEIVFKSVTRVV